jgi:SAM-dependent methyltransferase
VVQADLFKLPFPRESFEVVYSIGVLHHTPDTEKAFQSAVSYLKENGLISIWVYPDTPDLCQRLSDRVRSVTTQMSPNLLHKLCWVTVPAYYVYKIPFLGKALFHFLPPLSKEPYWRIEFWIPMIGTPQNISGSRHILRSIAGFKRQT